MDRDNLKLALDYAYKNPEWYQQIGDDYVKRTDHTFEIACQKLLGEKLNNIRAFHDMAVFLKISYDEAAYINSHFWNNNDVLKNAEEIKDMTDERFQELVTESFYKQFSDYGFKPIRKPNFKVAK